MGTNVWSRYRWWLAQLISACATMHGVAEVLPGGALAGERPRIIVSTDIGGADPDDIQSLVHYLLYADVFDTEGLISSPPGKGRTTDIHRAEYLRDWEKRLQALPRRDDRPGSSESPQSRITP